MVQTQRDNIARDEFMRWLLSQSIQLQEDTIFLSELTDGAHAGSKNPRIDNLRTEITRKVYELRVFSGDDRTVKSAASQLISVFGDHRSLEVIGLASRTLSGEVQVWLKAQYCKLRRQLYPPQFINSRAWTGSRSDTVS
jgi:hypothetical protein